MDDATEQLVFEQDSHRGAFVVASGAPLAIDVATSAGTLAHATAVAAASRRNRDMARAPVLLDDQCYPGPVGAFKAS